MSEQGIQIDRDRTTATQVWCADIPAPANPLTLGQWSWWEGEDCTRTYTTHTEAVGPVTVAVAGIQHNDGRTEPHITLDGAQGEELTPGQAQALAAALLGAAEALAIHRRGT